LTVLAIGLVMRTGDKTAIGAIAMLASDTEQRVYVAEGSPQLVKLIAIVAVTMAAPVSL
jgi:magnesium-transporting ATPase (P-type)